LKKKKLLYHSDSSFAKTGFGRCTKEVLGYLYRTNKYDIVEYCCGKTWSRDGEHKQKPWKSFGTVPDNPAEVEALAPDDPRKRMLAYGANLLDKIIYQEKPDVYIGVQDIWGIDYAADKPWFNNITSAFWTTLDSLPIIKSALDLAPKVKNFWVWSKFAEEAMKKLGHSHVRTIHGAINPSKFFKLKPELKAQLRYFHGIPQDAFVVGFVFRNQPRKSVPNLIEGYKIFKNNNPHIKNTRLLLHTYWAEGWRIHEFADEYKVPHNEIITTYVCQQCRSYKVIEYTGEFIDCPLCGGKKKFVTTSPMFGISEDQLNEVYNLMDVYCHPFNSGGQEIPVQEAKFAELITLVTSYSCGEEMCQDEAASLALDWAEYREPDSQFIKATTQPFSIAKQLNKVAKMSPAEREKMGKKAKNWALDNYSTEAVGKIIEAFLDEAPITSYEFIQQESIGNPFAEVNSNLNDEEWLIELYHKILGKKVDKFDGGVRNWLIQIKTKRAYRENIEQFFRQTAAQENEQKKKNQQFEALSKIDEKRILYVIPASERDLFLSSALFRSMKEQYPNHKLFVATSPQFMSTLDGNPYVDSILVYYSEMDNLLFLEGNATHKGYFDVAFLPHLHTQRIVSYIHNGNSNIAYGKCIRY